MLGSLMVHFFINLKIQVSVNFLFFSSKWIHGKLKLVYLPSFNLLIWLYFSHLSKQQIVYHLDTVLSFHYLLLCLPPFSFDSNDHNTSPKDMHEVNSMNLNDTDWDSRINSRETERV